MLRHMKVEEIAEAIAKLPPLRCARPRARSDPPEAAGALRSWRLGAAECKNALADPASLRASSARSDPPEAAGALRSWRLGAAECKNALADSPRAMRAIPREHFPDTR
jgi:hypothetical protein